MEKKIKSTIVIETEDEEIAKKILEAINKSLDGTEDVTKVKLMYSCVQEYVETKEEMISRLNQETKNLLKGW